MTMPLSFAPITDPYFYAVTIPAVLLLGVSKSGFGAGFGALAAPWRLWWAGLRWPFLAQRLLLPPQPGSSPPPNYRLLYLGHVPDRPPVAGGCLALNAMQ